MSPQTPFTEAASFIDPEKDVNSEIDALAGARDIIAEMINEDQNAREKMRELFEKKGLFLVNVIPGKEKEGVKYRDYFDLKESVREAPSHRVLAMRRGEKEGFLNMKVNPPMDEAFELLEGLFVKGVYPASHGGTGSCSGLL